MVFFEGFKGAEGCVFEEGKRAVVSGYIDGSAVERREFLGEGGFVGHYFHLGEWKRGLGIGKDFHMTPWNMGNFEEGLDENAFYFLLARESAERKLVSTSTLIPGEGEYSILVASSLTFLKVKNPASCLLRGRISHDNRTDRLRGEP